MSVMSNNNNAVVSRKKDAQSTVKVGLRSKLANGVVRSGLLTGQTYEQLKA